MKKNRTIHSRYIDPFHGMAFVNANNSLAFRDAYNPGIDCIIPSVVLYYWLLKRGASVLAFRNCRLRLSAFC